MRHTIYITLLTCLPHIVFAQLNDVQDDFQDSTPEEMIYPDENEDSVVAEGEIPSSYIMYQATAPAQEKEEDYEYEYGYEYGYESEEYDSEQE
jgi:hypothetical protein